MTATATPPPPALPAELLPEVFPFFLQWDGEMKLVSAGPSIIKACAGARRGVRMAEVFRILRPAGEWTAGHFSDGTATLHLLESIDTGLKVRGQVARVEGGHFLMLATPWISEPEEVQQLGLSMSDFPPHDQTMDLLQVVMSYRLSIDDLKKLTHTLTEQRAKLREQRAEARKLALVAARTHNSVVITDTSGCVEWVNEGFTRMNGWTLEEVVGKRPGSFLQGPETDRATTEFIRRKLANSEPMTVEILNYTKSGQKYWVGMEIQPVHDEDGRLVNFMAIQSDITARREADRQLRETAALQHAMIHAAGYAIIAADTEGTIELFNPAAERMLGYAASELVGKSTPGVFHDPVEVSARARELTIELGQKVEPGFQTFIAKARLGRPDQREWTYIRKDGKRLPVLLSVSALTDGERILGYLGMASDLSEQKSYEEKLCSALSELERMNRVMMNREERVLELKREINSICQASGVDPRYPSAVD
ncbi:PAS domain S-box protein [Haloferula sargassicola]|uniref:guanylate cyclase n=1 Tax=Haloferula sargassicola TaxID=490096 RepID=A0ABP9UK86_9BACT